MNYDVPKNQLYPMRLKGISICFTMLKAALSGNYVNFGVCKLYGDETLDNVLDVTTKLILTIPQTDLLVKFSILSNFFLSNQITNIISMFFFAVAFRCIQNCHNHISCFWSVWHKITWRSYQHLIRQYFCTLLRVYQRVWLLKV